MIYAVLRVFFTVYLRLFHSLKITGAECIPDVGSVILCANHSSYFDSMLIGLCTRRQVHFLVYDTFYRHWFLGPFIQACGAIPVTENGINKEAMKKALTVLKNGGVIGIFPEGRLTQTGFLSTGNPGAAMLAALSRAPIVPITIMGAFFVYPKGKKFPGHDKIMVKVNPPVTVDPVRRREKGYLQSVINEVMGCIGRSLLPALHPNHDDTLT
jgi:1-acyl-sn-glycerol-3-phosphate acyltransferase